MITAEEIYQWAKQLKQATVEVEQREYLKTAYYAVLHRIQEACDQNQIPQPRRLNTGIHEHIIERINVNYSGEVVSRYARKMKRLRKKADYVLNEDISIDELASQSKWLEECWYRLAQFTK